jgi:hypothetical protein
MINSSIHYVILLGKDCKKQVGFNHLKGDISMKSKSSKWRLSQAAFLVVIGFVIGSWIAQPNTSLLLGSLSGALILVVINLCYVLYTKRTLKSQK